MGCKGSKDALHAVGCGATRAPEPRRCSGLVPRHSVALMSSTLGTLSLDRATAAVTAAAAVSFGGGDGAMMDKSGKESAGGAAGRCLSTRWFPASPMMVEEPAKRQRRALPRTPARDPEEINVWELMEGLGDEDDDDGVVAESAAGSPEFEFETDVLSAFRDALAEFSPPPPDSHVAHDVGAVKKEEIQVFAGVVRARLSVFQQRIDDGKSGKKAPRLTPPESARRVVVYLTSLRGIRQTYEDCWAAATILSGYGVHVDERDLSMHAGYKGELRDALGLATPGLPQVFVDGWHLGGAEEVRRMHESGELAEALEACEPAPGIAGGGKEGSGFVAESCGGCGGARFVPCDVCSGSCKVFVEDEGAFRRCPECNENGLVRCPIC